MAHRWCVVLLTIFVCSAMAENMFTSCRFHFGTEMSKVYDMNARRVLNAAIIEEIDFFTGPWAGSDSNYNIGNFFVACKALNKTPVVVGYAIAFAAYRNAGLRDCNIAGETNSLCTKGANYIRQNKAHILRVYDRFAKGIARDYGTENPVIWCMEPDYSQYTERTQEGGGLTDTEASEFMGNILTTIKTSLPKSLFSMDISPWKDTTWQNNWFTVLNVASNFNFINTSGGQSKAASTYISDDWAKSLPTWAWVQKRWGKPMIADAGYGVSGSSTGHDANWDNVANLNNRIREGVIGVSQYNPKSDWGATIRAIRSQLVAPPTCGGTMVHRKRGSVEAALLLQRRTAVTGPVEVYTLSGRRILTIESTLLPEADALRGLVGSGAFVIRLHDGATVRRAVGP